MSDWQSLAWRARGVYQRSHFVGLCVGLAFAGELKDVGEMLA